MENISVQEPQFASLDEIRDLTYLFRVHKVQIRRKLNIWWKNEIEKKVDSNM